MTTQTNPSPLTWLQEKKEEAREHLLTARSYKADGDMEIYAAFLMAAKAIKDEARLMDETMART